MSLLLEDVHDDDDTGEDGSEQAKQLKYILQSKMKQSPSHDKEYNVRLTLHFKILSKMVLTRLVVEGRLS